MIKPNLFLVGLPKAGTTSLFNYLQEHSEIFFPEVKEPNFFNTDSNNKRSLEGLEEYLALFKKAKNERYIGEASTHYLMSSVAAENIKKFSTDAKIIIMLRKPSDLIYSAYYQNVYNGIETAKTFEEALMLENTRKINSNNKVSYAEALHLQYSRFVRYEKYLKNYYEVFGKKNILIIFFDDFKIKTEEEYNRVLSFLSLKKEATVSFKKYNASKKTKSSLIRSLLKKPPRLFVVLGKLFFSKKIRRKMLSYLKKKNTIYVKKIPILKETERILDKKYMPEVNKLEKLLDVDLSHWKS